MHRHRVAAIALAGEPARERVAQQRNADDAEDPQRRLSRAAAQALAPADEARVRALAQQHVQREQGQGWRHEHQVVTREQWQPLRGRQSRLDHQRERREVGQRGRQFQQRHRHPEEHEGGQSSTTRQRRFARLVRVGRREDRIGQQSSAQQRLRGHRQRMVEHHGQGVVRCGGAQHDRDTQAEVGHHDPGNVGQQARPGMRLRQQPQRHHEGRRIQAVEQRQDQQRWQEVVHGGAVRVARRGA
nr:hypothetical protein [Luteimonas saliphila]